MGEAAESKAYRKAEKTVIIVAAATRDGSQSVLWGTKGLNIFRFSPLRRAKSLAREELWQIRPPGWLLVRAF